jgi:hypothetical protein
MAENYRLSGERGVPLFFLEHGDFFSLKLPSYCASHMKRQFQIISELFKPVQGFDFEIGPFMDLTIGFRFLLQAF